MIRDGSSAAVRLFSPAGASGREERTVPETVEAGKRANRIRA